MLKKVSQDPMLGTVGWSILVSGTVGVAAGQTVRLGVVNVGPSAATIAYGQYINPQPVTLAQESFTLGPGEAHNSDLKASDLPKEYFDDKGRAQVRAMVHSSSAAICSNLEIFDDETGRTSVILPLSEMVQRT